MIFQEKCFSCYILLMDQISCSHYLYFSEYWATCVLRLFTNQAVASSNLKLPLSFLSSRFVTWLKKSRQKLQYLENKKSFLGELKSIFHHFKGLPVAKICLRPESAPLNADGSTHVAFLMNLSRSASLPCRFCYLEGTALRPQHKDPFSSGLIINWYSTKPFIAHQLSLDRS